MNNPKNAPDEPFVLTQDISPSGLVRLRCEALKEGRFDVIYDSAHAESNFSKHFPRRSDYLDYACGSLKDEILLLDYRVLEEETADVEAHVLFFADFIAHGERQRIVEVAHMSLTSKGWRYLYGEKARLEDLPFDLDSLTIEKFESVGGKTIF